MKVFLTGGSGMVGKNFLEHPDISNFDVFAPSHGALDLFNYQAVKEYITKIKPDIIVHAAGRVGGIHANMKYPVAFLIENLDMGRNIIYGAKECGVKKLINLGSSCMYPRNAQNPLKEEMILTGELEPTNEGYGLAKTVAARLCSYISSENSNYSYKTLIPCNLYGRWDKFSPKNSHMIPAVIRKINLAKEKNEKEVEIWGDGSARREFMYAGDLADCLIKAVFDFESLPDLMNVGLGYDLSINEYYESVAEVTGYKGEFTHDLTKPVGMSKKLVDISRQSEWGWSPKTGLKEGAKKTYDFFEKFIKNEEGVIQ